MNTDPTLYYILIPAIAMIVDIVCFIKLIKWDPPSDWQLKIAAITIISGLIIYFTIGRIWMISPQPIAISPDSFGDPASSQWLTIFIAIFPGLVGGTIFTYFKWERYFKKKYGKRKQ